MPKIDETGHTYGHLTVQEYAGYNKKLESSMQKCQCDCGKITIVRGCSLRSGESTSCGCHRYDKLKRLPSEYYKTMATKHGQARLPEYEIWNGMMTRCYCKSARHYNRYGGRGITVCEEWHNVSVFCQWAKETGYRKGMTLDRIDNNKGYSPDNCRWATRCQQARNRRTSQLVDWHGEQMCFADVVEKYGTTPYNTAWKRFRVMGWPIEKAIGFENQKDG